MQLSPGARLEARARRILPGRIEPGGWILPVCRIGTWAAERLVKMLIFAYWLPTQLEVRSCRASYMNTVTVRAHCMHNSITCWSRMSLSKLETGKSCVIYIKVNLAGLADSHRIACGQIVAEYPVTQIMHVTTASACPMGKCGVGYTYRMVLCTSMPIAFAVHAL
jgi:hypothetical protein